MKTKEIISYLSYNVNIKLIYIVKYNMNERFCNTPIISGNHTFRNLTADQSI